MEKRNSHGHTPAGWYSAITIFLGFVVGGFGIGAASLVLSLVGAAITAAGILLAVILQRAGLGQFVPAPNHTVTSAQDYLGTQRVDDDAPVAPAQTH